MSSTTLHPLTPVSNAAGRIHAIVSPATNKQLDEVLSKRPAAAALLYAWADRVTSACDELAELIVGDSGNLRQGRGDWQRSALLVRMAEALDCGQARVNTNTSVQIQLPFGGFKANGLGKELAIAVMPLFQREKTVSSLL